MVAQLVKNLIHFERSQNCFDERRGPDRPAGDADVVLSEIEHIVPQSGFEMTLELRQVKIGTGARTHQLRRVVEQKQPKIEERGRNWPASHQDVFLTKMPASGPNHKRGGTETTQNRRARPKLGCFC